jgi:acetyl esterase/lipase
MRISTLLSTAIVWLAATAAGVSAQDIYKDVPFDVEGHTLDIYRADPSGPTVFYVPGGNWYKHDKNLYVRLGVALAPYGINLIVPQYGQEQKYPNNLIDVAEAIRWSKANLTRFGIANTQFHLVGHSAGAHLSYMLFTDERSGLSEADFHSLTLISGLYDINFLVRYGNRWRNWNPLQGWHASPIKTKRLVCLPMTVIYAENDYDIVKRQTKHFLWANSHIGQPLRCFVIPNDDHVTELLNAETNGLLRIVIDTAYSTATGGIVSVESAPIMDMVVPAEPMIETQAVTPATETIPSAPAPEQTSPLSLEVPADPAPATPAAVVDTPEPAKPSDSQTPPVLELPKAPQAPIPAPAPPPVPEVRP